MTGKTGVLLIALILSGLALLRPAAGERPPQAASRTASGDAEEYKRLLAMGKELFVERCGKCHDADGTKPLRSGPPLSERKVAAEEVARAVNRRFKDRTEEERRAVRLYLEQLLPK